MGVSARQPDYTALPTATPQCHRGAMTESAAKGSRDYGHILCLFRQVHKEGRRGFCLSNLGTTEAALQVQEDDQSFLPMSLVVSRCTVDEAEENMTRCCRRDINETVWCYHADKF